MLSSCASYFTRKECESTNWFDYGQKVALDGRRLTGDDFITQCQQAETDVAEADLDRGFKAGLEKYCEPDTVYQIGKNGKFFSTEMCVGENLTLLRAKHQAGVQEYCQKSNGYSAGASGEVYSKICPAALEANFLPEFKRGRKKYLNTVIAQDEQEASRLSGEVSRLQSQVNLRNSELQSYRLTARTDDSSLSRMNSLNSEISSLNFNLNTKQRRLDQLREGIKKNKLEVIQMEP